MKEWGISRKAWNSAKEPDGNPKSETNNIEITHSSNGNYGKLDNAEERFCPVEDKTVKKKYTYWTREKKIGGGGVRKEWDINNLLHSIKYSLQITMVSYT